MRARKSSVQQELGGWERGAERKSELMMYRERENGETSKLIFFFLLFYSHNFKQKKK